MNLRTLRRRVYYKNWPTGPVRIDRARMEAALAGPRFTLPTGLSREQIRQYMADCVAGKIPPDPPIHELADRDAPPIIAKPLVTRPARSVKHLSEASAKI